MAKLEFEQFRKLAESGNLIPVYQEFLADMETPVSVLAHFAADENVCLFESVEGGERFGRYSFIGLNPRGVFRVDNGVPYYRTAAGETVLDAPDGAFNSLKGLLADVRAVNVPGLPPLFGGAVGYMGYETVCEFEKLPPPKLPPEGPTSCFMMIDEMVIFDNVRHTVAVSVCVRPAEFASLREAYDHARERIAAIRETMTRPLDRTTPAVPPRVSVLKPNMDKADFIEMIERAKRHIVEGDIIQVVPSQKFTADCTIEPLNLYRALRLVNPSPYTFFLKTGGRILIGSSPETMVKLDNGCATLRPIAGTRKRGGNQLEDMKLADELLSDEKERAEHLMLVDLGRNDLGRTARPGSVQVRDFMFVERYSHVMHLVSNIESVLRADMDPFDLVRTVFPAGTLSGAPKIRAMEIINELEPEPRGIYGGAVGYFSYTGNLDLAITIRTLLLEHGRLSVQSGMGIVYDSDPEAEYGESLNKAAAIFSAVKLAAANLEI